MMQVVLAVLRHLLGGFGGAVASAGWISEKEADLAVGAILTLVAILWSIWEKKPWRKTNFNTLPSILPLLLILAGAALLAGCAPFKGGFESPARTIYTVRATYDFSLLAPAVAYESLPRCHLTDQAVCSDQKAVAEIRKADLAAKAALDAAEMTVREHPELSPVAAIAAAENAVEAFRLILLTYGILKETPNG